jgi:hypothetical protein
VREGREKTRVWRCKRKVRANVGGVGVWAIALVHGREGDGGVGADLPLFIALILPCNRAGMALA